MTVNDEGMQVECDIYEADGTGKDDQRKIVPVRQLDHLLRDAAEVSSQLDT
ncbi:hypothetical protein D3C75_626760 [compost metagenome]